MGTVNEHSSNDKLMGISSISLTVADLDESLAFYTQVLSFQIISEKTVSGTCYEKLFGVLGIHARIATLKLGEEIIELVNYLSPEGRPMPFDTRSNDEWFQHLAIAVTHMGKAYSHLCNHNVQHASTKPQTIPDWNLDAGGIKAFYFRDPDGHHLEILWFPEGKGAPRWQKNAELFMGIDHSAIVVNDTDDALRFYRDILGMTVAGTSLNYGNEQEQLANVKQARVRITSLQGDFGPGLEFLEYLSPNTGRPTPKDVKSNDIMHWHLTAKVKDLDVLLNKMKSCNLENELIEPIRLQHNDHCSRAKMVSGPSGHSLILIE